MNLYYFPIQTVNLVANKTTSKEKKSPAQRSGGTWPHCGQAGKREGLPGEVRPEVQHAWAPAGGKVEAWPEAGSDGSGRCRQATGLYPQGQREPLV